jgi:hypothetical protein
MKAKIEASDIFAFACINVIVQTASKCRSLAADLRLARIAG